VGIPRTSFACFLNVNIHPHPVFRHGFDDDGTDEFHQAFPTIILPTPIVMTLLLADVARECPRAAPPSFVPKMAEINSVFETGRRNCLLGSASRGKARDDVLVVRCVEGFFALVVKWVKRPGSGAETGGVLAGAKEWPAKQPTVIPVVTIGRRYYEFEFVRS
jgi:hypothetical protein